MMMSFVDRLRRLLAGAENGARAQEGHGGDPDAPRPIPCSEALERVHEYLDGELGEELHRDVAHHFSVCQECYPHLRLEERFKEIFRRAQAGESAPEHLRKQVLDLLAAEGAKGEEGS